MSLSNFLNKPYNSCCNVFSIGKPKSGKTYLLLNALKNYWLPKNTFSEVHLVLPTFNYEQNNSYKFLKEYKGKTNIKIYLKYTPEIAKKLIEQQKKNNKNRVLFAIDDTTHQKNDIFYCPYITEIATTSRHLNIHFFVILHYAKGIIPKNAKEQTHYFIIYQLNKAGLKDIYENYFDFMEDFENEKEFIKYMNEIYTKHKNGGLLFEATGPKSERKYNPNVSNFFD